MYLSVIICTYNQSKIIKKCLQSVINCDSPGCQYEVIVIDNNSNDDTVGKVLQFIKQNKNSEIHLFQENRQGLSFAKNRGIREAKGEILFFLDDDAIIDSRCLYYYRTYYEEFGYKCMGGKILPWIINKKNYEYPRWFNKSYWGSLSFLDWGEKNKRVFYPRFPFGGNWAVARDLFEEYGLLNNNMGRKGKNLISNEEYEFMMRLEDNGEPIHYVPDAIIYHLFRKERLKKTYFFKRNYAQGLSDAYMLFERKRVSYVLKLLPKKFLEIIFAPSVYLGRRLNNRPDYFLPIFRVLSNFGFLLMTLKLLFRKRQFSD